MTNELTEQPYREALEKRFVDVEDMLSKVSGQLPMLSEEVYYVHELDHQIKVFTFLTVLGAVMVLLAVLRNVM
jgi:hypothetical protein